MYNYYDYNELYHHGIKGMKWGVRRYQNKDGSLTEAGRKRYGSYADVIEKKTALRTARKEYSKSFNKAYNRSFAGYSPIKKHRQANDERWNDAYDKAKALEKAESEYKKAKQTRDKAAVKAYVQKKQESKEAQNLADKKWNEVSEQYRALGENVFQRAKAVASSNSNAVKKYKSAWDEAENFQYVADMKMNGLSKAYKETGRNLVERIINNSKYGR